MIISRTPFRVSFFGGGTDYPDWYKKNKGAVLATTIDKYCYITCRYLPPFFDHSSRIIYSQMEHVRKIDDIDGIVRIVERRLKGENETKGAMEDGIISTFVNFSKEISELPHEIQVV